MNESIHTIQKKRSHTIRLVARKYAAKFSCVHTPTKHVFLVVVAAALAFILMLVYTRFNSLPNYILFFTLLMTNLFTIFFAGIAFGFYPIGIAPKSIRLMSVLYSTFSSYCFFLFFALVIAHQFSFNVIALLNIFASLHVSSFNFFGVTAYFGESVGGIVVAWLGALLLSLFIVFIKKPDLIQE